MGLAASMKVIPAALFEQYKSDLADLDVPRDAASFWLDKAWLELHTTLRRMPKPLCLAVSGDCPVDGQLDGGLIPDGEVESDDEGEDDCYIGYASPKLVPKVGRALGQLSENELLAAIQAEGWPSRISDQRSYRVAFDTLKTAYHTAAEAGDALLVVIT